MVYKKRGYRKARKTTKKFNKYVYAKTDSRNQAKQIVKLNKKISNVYKTLRPELNKVNNNAVATISQAKPVMLTLTQFLKGNDPMNIFSGNYAKLVYFNFRMYFNPNMRDLTAGHTYRIIVFQTKKGLSEAPTAADLFDDDSLSWGVCMPFRDNINVQFKILLSRVVNISTDKDYLYRSYNFKKLIGYKKTDGDLFKYPRGSIFVCVLAPNDQAELSFNWISKLGYVDQYMKPINVV